MNQSNLLLNYFIDRCELNTPIIYGLKGGQICLRSQVATIARATHIVTVIKVPHSTVVTLVTHSLLDVTL